MNQKLKRVIVFTLVFSFLLLGAGVFTNKNSEVKASDGEMLTMLRGMNQVLVLIADTLSVFRVRDGNVGIGTTSPRSRLDVHSSGTITRINALNDGGYTMFSGMNYSNTAWQSNYFIGYRARGTLTDPKYLNSGDYILQLSGHGWDEKSSEWKGVANISFVAGSNWSSAVRNTAIRFYTTEKDTIHERMRITGPGNVGIGTTSPQETLHVAGNLKVDGNIIGGSPVKFANDIEVKGKMCLEDVCLSKDELEKLKELLE